MFKVKFIVLFLISILFIRCTDNPIPKPRAYKRIDLPKREYNLLDSTLPFKIKYPIYSKIISENKEENWISLDIKSLNAKIHLSYKSINNNLRSLSEDARELSMKHIPKAEAIEEIYINDSSKSKYGILYYIEGNTASSTQFYITDSINHFLRGALYFNCEPNKDSLAPVIAFLRKDIDNILESLEWKNH